ncbi:hypothetical protein ABT071_36630 [Streptomyces sp. NPDC002506]|uniref:hypothetical protein n=1 Tax=Streptomyces sp. NPDC002506 TaxID=3154536 RepID=UPI00332F8838
MGTRLRQFAGAGYWASPTLVMRTAPMPVSALEPLRAELTWEAAASLAPAYRWLVEEARALSGALAALSLDPRTAATGVKPALAGLRRALGSVRPPDDWVWAHRAWDALPDEICGRVERWLGELERYEPRAAELAGLYARELRDVDAALRKAVPAAEARTGVLGPGSAALFDSPDERADRLLLARSLARATTRTGPRAPRTELRFVPGDASGAHDRDVRTLPQRAGRLAARPELARRLRVRVNATALEADGWLWFLGPAPGEPVSRVRFDEAARTCLDLVRAVPGRTLGGLRTDLLTRGGQVPEQADTLIEELTAAGLLELHLPAAVTAEQSHPDRGELTSTMRELRIRMRESRTASNTRERAEIRSAARGILRSPALGPGRRPYRLPERARAAVRPPRGASAIASAPDWNRWQPACDQLDTVRRLVGLFDPDLPLRLALASVLEDRFPHGTSLLTFYRYIQRSARALHEPAHERLGPAELRTHLAGDLAVRRPPFHSDLAPIRRLDRLRRDAVELLRSGPRDADGTVHADLARLADLIARRPACVRAPESVSCFVQPLPSEPGAAQRLVLNRLSTGFGTQSAPGGTPYAPTAAGRVFAETDAVFGGGPEHRGPRVGYSIDYPCTSAERAPQQRIRLPDLYVTRDAATGLPVLRSQHLEAEVTPLHLGAVPVALLPPVLRFLVRGFAAGAETGRPLWAHLLPDPGVGHDGGVRHLPRIGLGPLTLTRATWHLRADLFPVRHPDEPRHVHLVRLAAWLDEQGIPRRFFARTAAADAPGQYVDVSVHRLLEAFTQAPRAEEDVLVLQEALPAPTDAPARPGQEARHITEYVLELSSPEVRRG